MIWDLVELNSIKLIQIIIIIIIEAQVKSIADHIRPDRQCLMFSATMKTKVERLAMHALHNPVKIVCGDVGEANADVQQHVFVLANLQAKFAWLHERIVQLAAGEWARKGRNLCHGIELN